MNYKHRSFIIGGKLSGKRWLLTLFTPIHRKIKIWSYYQRCISFHTVCIKNPLDEKEPIAFVFEKYLGKRGHIWIK